ncbi:MAG: zinc ribbon domain-containing protein [Phycisphaerae bacterium]|nr:zinc ribbon domain-containing protein [Phycisphaerae bacterium]
MPDPTPQPTAKPPKPTAKGGESVMDRLLADSPLVGGQPCGNCGAPLPKGAALCTRCGFDVSSGKPVRTRVIAERVKKEKGGPRQAPKWLAPAVLVLILAGLAVAYFTGALSGVIGGLVDDSSSHQGWTSPKANTK